MRLRNTIYALVAWVVASMSICCGRNESAVSVRGTATISSHAASPDGGDVASAGARPSTPLNRLDGYPWLTALGRTESGNDVATPPLGATEPRPIVVAVHGAGDRPEWACGGWRIGLEAYPFVVCPVGQPMGHERYAWTNAHAIGTAIERALEALSARFDGYCSPAPMVYVGFSQGATLAARFLVENARRFPTAVLAEGGYDYIGAPWFSRKYFEAGGRRVFLLCGTPGCFVAAARASKVMQRAGLHVVVAGNSKAGHNLNGLMQQAIRQHWHELVTTVPGWETYRAHRSTSQP